MHSLVVAMCLCVSPYWIWQVALLPFIFDLQRELIEKKSIVMHGGYSVATNSAYERPVKLLYSWRYSHRTKKLLTKRLSGWQYYNARRVDIINYWILSEPIITAVHVITRHWLGGVAYEPDRKNRSVLHILLANVKNRRLTHDHAVLSYRKNEHVANSHLLRPLVHHWDLFCEKFRYSFTNYEGMSL